MHPTIEFDADLIARMSQRGPRYTSYPTADRFVPSFGAADLARAARPGKPLSLYVHIPFCESLCYYCACNKIITQDRDKAVLYLDYLKREIAMQGEAWSRACGPKSVFTLTQLRQKNLNIL